MDYSNQITKIDNPELETYGSFFAELDKIQNDESGGIWNIEGDYSYIKLVDNIGI